MRQVKLIVAALSLCFSIGLAAFDDPDSNIDYSAPEYNNSLQEDNVSDNEKEDDSVDNVLNDYGPITVCADRAIYDSEKGTLTYYGDVFVMQIHHKHIICKKPNKSSKKKVVYFTRDKNLSFKQLQEKWFDHAKELCLDEKECNFISGQKLTMKLTDKKKVKTLTMESKGEELSQFYTFPTDTNPDYKESKKITKGPLDGVSKLIIYNVVGKDLELHKKAIVHQNENEYKGDKIIYDMNHDLVSIPGSRNKRSRIVLDGYTKETKLDTGLTPISDYDKKTESNNSNMTVTDMRDSSISPDQQQTQGL